MSKTAELKSAGTRFVMNNVVWNANAKLAQVVYTALASMEQGYSTLAQDAATKACDSLLMQRAVALLIEDDPQYAKICAKTELARILSGVNLGEFVDATEFSESLAELFCDTLNQVNTKTFEWHPGYRVSQFVVGKYNSVAVNLPFEAVLKGRGNSRCYKIVGRAHPALTFDHDGNPSLDWHLSSYAEGATPPSRIGTRVVKDDYQGFVTV